MAELELEIYTFSTLPVCSPSVTPMETIFTLDIITIIGSQY